MNHYGRQSIDDEDITAVVEALRSNFLTTGPRVEAFEQAFSAKIDAEYAIAVSSGTAALHLVMLAIGVGEGDRVVTSPNSFLASANCAVYAGAIPDFSDIENVGFNISPDQLEANWKEDTKAIIAVDYAGQPADMPRIAEFARSKGAWVVEDACHSVGTSFKYQGKSYQTGSHPWADVTVFSFHPVKTITAGEGGMITTSNPEIAAKLRRLRNHGMVKEVESFIAKNEVLSEKGPWYYEMHDVGFNYRITDIQCALASSQLKKLDRFIEKRALLVNRYNERLCGNKTAIKVPRKASWLAETPVSDISWHLYTLQIDFDQLDLTRTDLMFRLKEEGIGTQVLYIPIYLQPWYQQQYQYAPSKCPVAEQFYAHALSLPLHPTLTVEDVDFISDQLLEVL